jgi:hypothetical protein
MEIKILVSEPFLPVEEYARRTGETVDSIRGQIRRGKIPIKQKQHAKDRVYINMTALHMQAIEELNNN